ncbi:hypothetical protein K353_06555 [Kitasatospora sp. SolWspMP-SS2h]|uniref:hypothetical protein n=1 Tax=Kitasatospora sp. SolWspMP-SS2h TaxID=1305729 RepID=UPI000DC04908|nr:hypothetical protein [Kitasatospora sp. SolWspMP-SS2h]RAJ29851.1 hypothetical protein K353_06555 [Kitasatospora sp. SolWspMP-SS2h]
MRALVVNRPLKPPPAAATSEVLATVVAAELAAPGAEVATVRAVDLDLRPCAATDMGDDDRRSGIHDQLLAADTLIDALRVRAGPPSSIAQRVPERVDTMVSGTDGDGWPTATAGTWTSPSASRRTCSASTAGTCSALHPSPSVSARRRRPASPGTTASTRNPVRRRHGWHRTGRRWRCREMKEGGGEGGRVRVGCVGVGP